MTGSEGTSPSTTDLTAAVADHCRLFNDCVGTGNWAPFIASFTEDARMTLVGQTTAELSGRAAIAAAYDKRPPGQTMTIENVERVSDDTVNVSFTWQSGEPGSMVVTWRDGAVAAVQLST